MHPSVGSSTSALDMRVRRDYAVIRTSEPPVLFGDYAVGWIDHQVELARAGLIRANTIARFESALAAHLVPFFASYPLCDITRERCEAFRGALYQYDHLAPRTVNALMEVLRLVLRRAIQDGVMHRPDPTLGIRPLWTAPRRVDCYSPTEVEELLAATPAQHRGLVGLAVLAGLRQGEIHALRIEDVDLPGGAVHVRSSLQRPHRLLSIDQRLGPPKSPAAVRTVPLRARAAKMLAAHVDHHMRPNPLRLVFPGKAGQPLEPANFRHRVYLPAVERARLRLISFHDLRATFITHCAEAGIPIVVIARWVGHTTTKTTELYLHSTPNAERAALALLRTYDERDDAAPAIDLPG